MIATIPKVAALLYRRNVIKRPARLHASLNLITRSRHNACVFPIFQTEHAQRVLVAVIFGNAPPSGRLITGVFSSAAFRSGVALAGLFLGADAFEGGHQ